MFLPERCQNNFPRCVSAYVQVIRYYFRVYIQWDLSKQLVFLRAELALHDGISVAQKALLTSITDDSLVSLPWFAIGFIHWILDTGLA
jgi:hypothetical protein